MSNPSQQRGASTRVRSRWTISVRYFLILLVVVALIVPAATYVALAQQSGKPWHEVRTIYMEDYELGNPQGLAFSPDANAFLLWQEDGSAKGITMYEEPVDVQGLKVPAADVRNIAFNGHTKKLFALGNDSKQLKEIPFNEKGLPVPGSSATQSYKLDGVDLQAASGITFDPATGRMFVLNAKGDQLVVTPDPASGLGTGANASTISLKALQANSLQGIAFNPQDGHLYLPDSTSQRLYELTQDGKKISEYDLSSLGLSGPKTLVFAPSVDRTDDPSTMNLFLLDSGKSSAESAKIVELSLQARGSLPGGTPILPASLVRVQNINNTVWDPSSPDPSGIDYWPQKNRLLITDSEVDEMPLYWDGANVFTATTSGALVSTCSTLDYNNEPTGLAINPNTNRIYISSDRHEGLYYEINVGPDGEYCTSDDVVSEYVLTTDLEDVAYGNNTLFFAGGVDAEVYYFNLGANQVIGGGDDGPMQHFDTNAWGFFDMEGIGFHSGNGTILLHGSMGNGQSYVAEVSQTGTLLRAYDVSSFMGGESHMHSDIAYAPGSANPAVKNIYIVSRGVDNNSNSRENDGKWWEISLGGNPITPTPPTQVVAPVQIRINGSPVPGSPFSVAAGESTRRSFDNIEAGPVQLISNTDIMSAERVIYTVNGIQTSYSEMMGLPVNELDNIYWLPWYNNYGLDTQLSIANTTGVPATVHVYIGDDEMQGSPFQVFAGQSVLKSYPAVNDGPVKVESDVNLVVSERIVYTVNGIDTSFSELMALPEGQLDNTYWLPWYNNYGLDTQLRIANVTDQTATVTVTIGDMAMPSFQLPGGVSTRVSYPSVNDGPVKIESNVNIVAAERVIYKVQGNYTSYTEMMALPENQLTTTYWLPWYNNYGLDTQVRFANTTNSTANVHIYIGGVEMQGSPFTLTAGKSTRESFANINNGPVKIVSNVPIVAAERVIYTVNGIPTSFSELMGLPANKLDSTFWFPWYNNVSLDTQLRFGVP
ncbi:MAG TPA: hypothetical protein VFG81_18005 [Anaerolineales bacterium]|nr:hypothetical protein [Anaerolineales bacterium]